MERLENEFAAALGREADSRVTIDLPTIWRCFYTVRPELKNNVTSRQRLAADLQTLAESDAISLPASKSSFDRTALPALPRFVRLLRKAAGTEAAFDHQTFPWSLPMSFVAGLARLPNPEIAQKLNNFFRGDWASRILVPVKERSYEIFSNEKMLERVLDGQLGYEGRLNFDILRCYRVPIVPVHRVFTDGIDVIIIENEATFDSVSRWNTEHKKFRMVIYGRGREVEKIADFLLGEVQLKPSVIYYFGDLDRLGISMPYRLSQRLERRGGRGICPATACYRLLLRQLPTKIAIEDMEDEVDDPTDSEWAAALAWLPKEMRNEAEIVLTADRRIAQEAIGWEILRNENSLI